MDADEPSGHSTPSGLDKLPEADRPATPALVDGLRLIKAYLKIKREEDRQRVIDLANRLSNERS
jgi:hypothetical protein